MANCSFFTDNVNLLVKLQSFVRFDWCLALACSVFATVAFSAQPMLQDKQWNHGSADCAVNKDPAIEVHSYSSTSYILRQNKCQSFEAPFMYLLIGKDSALLLDTGATADAVAFPLYETVNALVGEKHLLVVHSHGHRDHIAADPQFDNREGVTLVTAGGSGYLETLGIMNWPDGEGRIDLGGRELRVIPVPGHQEESIAIYDPETQWLLTGDTVYPGLIYVKNWDDYRMSIARLARFASANDVSMVLGAHIEVTHRQGEYYPVGTSYQPEEAPLPINPATLSLMHTELEKLPKANEVELARLRIIPMNLMQRTLTDFARWMMK